MFCATLLPCFVLYMQDMVLNLTERRERGKVEIVDYLENVCQPRMENEFFHQEEMQEYRKEYFDKEKTIGQVAAAGADSVYKRRAESD